MRQMHGSKTRREKKISSNVPKNGISDGNMSDSDAHIWGRTPNPKVLRGHLESRI